jgi:hypothetical protein
MEMVEKGCKTEQLSSAKELRKGRKRKSQVRFSSSPTREETGHHADVEDNVAITETPAGRRRMVRPSKMLDMVKTFAVKSKPSTDLHRAKRSEDKSNKRKRRESFGNQSSDGTAETVEAPNDRKKPKPELVTKSGKVGSVRHPSLTKEETLAKSANTKVSKSLTEDSPKTKSNMKQQTVGEDTQKAVVTSKHNTRHHHHHEVTASEPEVKRGKRQEPVEAAIRSSSRRRSSSRDIRSGTNSNAGEFLF